MNKINIFKLFKRNINLILYLNLMDRNEQIQCFYLFNEKINLFNLHNRNIN
jgi:hypothetical protein